MLEAMAEAKLQSHLKTLDNLNHAVDEAKRLEHRLMMMGLDENYNLVCRKEVLEVLSELEKEAPAEVDGIFKSFLGNHIVHLGAQTTDKDIAAHCKGVLEKWREASKAPSLVRFEDNQNSEGPQRPGTPPGPPQPMTPPGPRPPMTPPGTPPPSVTTQDGNLATDIKRLVEMLIEDRNQMARERRQISEEREQMSKEGSNDQGKRRKGQREGKGQEKIQEEETDDSSSL